MTPLIKSGAKIEIASVASLPRNDILDFAL